MIVIPAIDVLGGRCVRLRRGDYATRREYSADPVATARAFLAEGAERLHVVDLDAARGRPVAASAAAVRGIVAAVGADCVVQVGGGVRSVEIARGWVDIGAAMVVLGTVAVRDPRLARDICEAVDGRALLGLDAREGRTQVMGWTEGGPRIDEVLRSWESWPAQGIVYTNTARDGMLAGPDLDGVRLCMTLYAGAVYVSGGVASLDDIAACVAAGAAGVVIGSALYERRVRLADALRPIPAGEP